MTCRCVAPVDVTVYRDPASAEGRSAALFLDRKGVRWEDVDVTSEPDARQRMQVLSGQTERPVIVVDGQTIVGYDPAILDPLIPSRF